MTSTQLIANRIKKWNSSETEATNLLNDLIARHDGDNLVCALCYEGFATERQAYRFIGAQA